MSHNPASFWSDDTSVFFSSFWGWTPETWGCVGWTGDQGLTHRTNLLKELTDPFIAVVYVTKSADAGDQTGKIVGFYLMSHETGNRNDFTHPKHHGLGPEKWEHSLRALRAFSYLPEHWITAADFVPNLMDRARAVAKWGEVLTDHTQIWQLKETPWVETDVYVPAAKAVEVEEEFTPLRGYNRAGPANREGYVVSSSAQQLKRQLYVLRLGGNTDAYLGRAAQGRQIYKIGLSASPEMRKQSLQSALPNGAFCWEIHFHSTSAEQTARFSFDAAVAGEDAMKRYLSVNADWLGGEFYLASTTDIQNAWDMGVAAAHQSKLI